MKNAKETCPAKLELLRRWRVIGEPGGPAPSDELSFLGRKRQEAAISQWKFLTEYVVADQEVPQEAARSDSFTKNATLKSIGKKAGRDPAGVILN